ncbi:MAG: hypothetical protein ACJAYE_003306 [Candidatus Azotimanducaceae bacterium]|jgi:hypothetical protein
MRVRQIALVAEQLASTRAKFFELLGVDGDFADKGVAEFGLENSVMAIGDTFLEIVVPTQPGTTAGRLLERRGGDGGYMVLLQVDDLAPYHEHLNTLKVRKVWEADMPEVKAFHIHPRDISGAIVSLDQMTPPESWKWAGPNWQDRKANNVGYIDGVVLQAADPDAMAARWSEVLKAPLANRCLSMENSSVAFKEARDGRGDGVSGLSFAGCDLAAVKKAAESLGLKWQDNVLEIGGVQLQFT